MQLSALQLATVMDILSGALEDLQEQKDMEAEAGEIGTAHATDRLLAPVVEALEDWHAAFAV